jgi:DNA-binding GntR family transcriptional regulator
VQREAGMPIVIKLVQLSITNSFIVKNVSFADLGHRFGVSRTHVRNLLREAQSMGLTEINGREIVLTPRLMAAFDRFVADGMAGLDLLFRFATANSAEAIAIKAAR